MDDILKSDDTRRAAKALSEADTRPITPPLRDDIFVTYEGVICVPGVGYMHPYAFRDIAGEEAYNAVINRPWKPSEYTDCDCPGCQRADTENEQ